MRFFFAIAIAIGLALTTISAQIPGRNVNMVSGTTFPDGDPFLQRQNEPSIAASTRNPLHLLGGSNDYRTVDIPGLCTIDPATGKCIEPETGDAWLGLFKSTDGGQRWKSTLLPGYPQDQSPAGLQSPLKSYQAGADSVVRAGTHGLIYYSGLVFDRGEDGKSAVFLSRFIDNNNQEAGDPFAYLGTSLVVSSTGTPFLDKPWMAVDIPRGNAAICSIDAAGAAATAQDGRKNKPGKAKGTKPGPTPVGQQIPAGAIYVTYTAFTGEGPTLRAEVMLKRSTDCGVTWSPGIRVSNPQDRVNQGTSIAIDPKTGAVFVAYRRFDPDLTDNDDLDAMMVARLPVGAGRFDPPGRAHKFAKLGKHVKRDLDRLFEHRGKEEEEEFERPGADPQEVSDQVDQFDLGTSGFNFRTNAYPTMAADGTGRIYIAWTQRGFTADTDGDDGARLVITTTRDGRSFAPLRPIEDHNQPGRGHQLMPSMTFAGGKLMVVFYDIRETQALAAGGGVHDRTVSDANKIIRHTIDIRSAMALPADMPDFADSVQVSEYQMGFNPRSGKVEELQANPPNLPMFQKGTVPFMGDYIDVAAAPAFIPGANGKWTYNTEANGVPPVFHAAWTDNRDVRPPTTRDPVTGKLDWTKYTPAKMSPDQAQRPSIFMPGEVVPECTVNNNNAGSRNQNVYSARITGTGLVAGSPGNTKPLSPVLQRAFVVFAQNTEDFTRSFRMRILNQPPGGRASFEQFPLPPFTSASPAPRITIEMIVPARSTASRTVYITSSDPNARVDVRISELVDLTTLPPSAYPTAGELGGGATAIVMLNPDIENPDIENPDIENPDIENPDIENAEVYTPDIENPDIENPDIENPDIENPDIENPDIENPDIENPDIENVRVSNPDIENPDIENPDIENPDIENPDIENPDIENPDIENGAIADVTWTVTNAGNTTAAFNVNLFLAQQQLPSSIATQLILLKTYRTPVTVPNGCQLAFQVRNVLVTNISNPTLIPPNGEPSNPNDPEIRNATLWLSPGEEGRIVLRVFDNDTSDNVLVEKKDANGNPILDKNGNPKMVSIDRAVVPSEDVTPVVQQQSVNSEDAEDGITEPPLVPAFPSPQATDDLVSTTYQTPVTLNVLANDSNAFGSIKIHSAHPAGLGQNMGGGANQLAYLPGTGLLYAGSGRGVGVIDPVTDRLVGRIPGPPNWLGATYAVASTRTNVVYLRSGGSQAPNATLQALDARPGSATYHQFLPLPAMAGGLQTFTIDDVRQRLYVFHGNAPPASTFVTAIDINPLSATFHQALPGYPLTMPAGIRSISAAVNAKTGRVWVVMTGSSPLVGTYYFEGGASAPVATKVPGSGGGYAIAVNDSLNLVFTATFGPSIPGTFPQGEVRIDAINGATGALFFQINPSPMVPIGVGVNEKRLVIHRPTGKVYLRGHDHVIVVDGNRGSPTFGTHTVVPVGHAEGNSALVVDESRGVVVVANSSSLYTTLIDVATNAVYPLPGTRPSADLALDEAGGRVFRSAGGMVEELAVSAFNQIAPLGQVAVFPEVTEVLVNPVSNRAYVGTTVFDATMNLSSGAGFAGPLAGLPHRAGRYSFGARHNATNTFFVGNSDADNAGLEGRPGSVLVIDGATDAATATVPTINNPFGAGMNQNTAQLYMAGFSSSTDGQIGVHDVANLNAGVVLANTSAIVRQVINGNPQRIGYGRFVAVNHATNRAYFAVQNGSNTALAFAEPTGPGVAPVVLPIDLTPHLPADFTLGNTRVQGLLTHAGLNRIYVGVADLSQDPDLYRVLVFDGTTHNLLWSYQGGGHSNQHTPSWLALNEFTNRLYVVDFNADKVTLLNAVSGAVVTERALPNGPAATAINTANGHLYVSNELDKSISALDGATLEILSTVKLPLVAFFMEVDEVEGRIYTSGGNTADESGTMVITDVLGKLGIDVSVTNVTNGVYGTAVINQDFSITYTPRPNLSCPAIGCDDTFTYTVTNQGGSAEGTVSVHIVAPNPVPVAVNDQYVVTQGQQLIIGTPGLLANDIGVDGPVQITLFSPGGLDSLSINDDGSLTYDPAPEFTGTKTFGYSITVGGVTSNTASLTFDVRTPVSFVVTNTNDSGAGSLRQAIQLANAESIVSPVITFNIPGAGPHRIQLASASPIIAVPMIIDGYTQPGAAPNTLATGSNAIIMIEVRGTGTGGFNPGMNLVGAPTTVRGLAIGNFSAGFNLDQFPGTAVGHHVEGNFIGVSATGAAMPNNNGIEVRTQNHVIGGATPAARNVISGNLNTGIRLTAQTNGATEVFNHGGGTTVINNLIGTAPSGLTALGNGNAGVSVSVPNVTIGGPSAALGNVISGNTGDGITSFANSFDPAGPEPPVTVIAPTNLVVQGNRIGVNIGGAALGNLNFGVNIHGTSLIGGTAGVSPLSCTGACNVISGNLRNGVNINSTFDAATGVVFGSGAGTQVIGNYIGLNPSGTAAAPNGPPAPAFSAGVSAGVMVQIGGSNPLERNIISGNNGAGINLYTQTRGAGIVVTSAAGTEIKNNYIGLSTDGVTAFGNGNDGIGLSVPNVTIGGLPSERNVIAANAGRGINTFASMFDPDGGGPLPSTPLTPPVVASSVKVLGNFIGTTAAGDAARPNNQGMNSNGPDAIIQSNLISGNTGNGLNIGNHADFNTGQIYSSGSNALVQGNKIGVNLAGTAALANTSQGITISAPNATIGGNISPGVPGRNIIAGNGSTGISLFFNLTSADVPFAVGPSGTVIKGNYVGLDANGALLTNAGGGIFSGVPGITIGGPNPGDGNFVAAPLNQGAINLARQNGNSGGVVSDGGTSTIQGNTLGLSPAGARLNARGFLISISSSGNQVIGNTVAGNGTGVGPTVTAIFITGDSGPADNNVITGNFVGTDAAGTPGLHNLGTGIGVRNASGTVIGGSVPGERNVVVGSGSAGSVGVSIFSSSIVSGTSIKGNYIGIMPDGLTPQDPARATDRGVELFTFGAGTITNTVIGGATAGDRNVLSSNGAYGVRLFGAGISGTTLQGNYIGVAADGITPRGNGLSGIWISDTSNNTIGGALAAEGNLIAHNATNGIGLVDDSGPALGNRILSNRFRSNGALAIEISPSGANANDPGDGDGGPNNRQNFPVLSEASNQPGPVTRVTADLTSFAVGNYTVQFYASDTCDASGFGEGERLISTFTNVPGGSNTQYALAELIAQGDFITAIATDSVGNTSEFSACAEVDPSGLQVSNTNNGGNGSLRDAIDKANLQPGTQTITFNIPGAGAGSPAVIALATPLPVITDPVVINGASQPGYTTQPLIEINGAAIEIPNASGLVVTGAGTTIRGLSITGFSAQGIHLNGASQTTVEDSWIGVRPNGAVFGNGSSGVYAVNASDNTLRRNVIGGSGFAGVFFFGAANNNRVENSRIGTDPSGNTAYSNVRGVGFEGSSTDRPTNNIVSGNLISGNIDSGIRTDCGNLCGAIGTQILGNTIGVSAFEAPLPNGVGLQLLTSPGTVISGNTIAGNTGEGITINEFGALPPVITPIVIRNNKIGISLTVLIRPNGVGIRVFGAVTIPVIVGDNFGQQNLIRSNNGAGIWSQGAAVTVRDNVIDDNGGLGIDVGPAGVTANDPGDTDGVQNFPVLSNARIVAGPETEVSYDTTSFAPGSYTVRFYSGPVCDPTGFGEGSMQLAVASLSGGISASILLPAVTIGHFITATATDASGRTSEFSACVAVTDPSQMVVTNSNDSGPGSLRQLITQANTALGTQTITFNIPGATPVTPAVITVASPLPNITESVIIDATTQPGWDGRPVVSVRSPSSTTGWVGFFLDSSNITIRGLSISNFGQGILAFQNHSGHLIEQNYIGTNRDNTILGNGVGVQWRANTSTIRQNVISGNSGDGLIVMLGATANTVDNNKIGMGWDGTTVVRNTGNGVVMFDGPANNVLSDNLISGNTLWGVDLQHSGTLAQVTGTVFRGNRIGLDANGDDAGNASGGIRVQNAPGTTIGLPDQTRNVISGNGGPQPFNIGVGIHVVDTMSPMPLIRNNLIGLDPAGLTARPNLNKGIVLDGPARIGGPRIGGNPSGEGNYISGHTDPGGGAGIIANLGAAGTEIFDNVLGLNVNNDAVGNGYSGITIRTAGSVNVEGNVIAGNGAYGISIIKIAGGDPNPSNTTLRRNWIGTDATGTLVRGNGQAGVRVEGTNHLIGGLGNPGNVIANNGNQGGVIVVGAATTVELRQNIIRDNRGLGIDLGGDGPTPNDAGDGDDGPNLLQNYPPIVSAVNEGGVTKVRVQLFGFSGGWEFFSSPACGSSGRGEAALVHSVAGLTNVGGIAEFELQDLVPSSHFVTATGVGTAGGSFVTSELSPCVQVTDVVEPFVFFGEGSFGESTPMNHPRRSQAAVRLDNGQVLLAGSDDFDTSADLFDPTTGIIATGPLGTGRCYGCAAVKLLNGEVLVAAGYVSNTAERYVPSLGMFKPVSGTMFAARLGPSATLLDDGKVLIAGGHNGFSPVGSAERYDPVTDTFIGPVINMSTSRLAPATKLADGKVLFTGGMTLSGLYTTNAELFDPSTLSFSQTPGNMSVARHGHQQTLLRDGRVLVTGGLLNGNAQTGSTEIYDPATGLFSTASNMNMPRTGHSATLLRNGYVLVTGGETTGGTVVSTAEVFNPTTGLWVTVPGLAMARAGHSATELNNGRVLIAGGSDQSGSRLATTELYSVNVIEGFQFIADGMPLSARQLFAWSNVPGSFVYSPGAGTVLGLGTHNLTATLTPDDAVTYSVTQGNSTLNVVPPPVITSVIPSDPSPGQMITIVGTNLNAENLDDVIFTQGSEIPVQYVFSNSTTRIVARTSASLQPGASNLRVQNPDGTIASAAFPVNLSQIPSAPIVQGVFSGTCGSYGFGGTPENPASITTALSGQNIVAAAHGIDTSGTTFIFTPLFGGGAVSQPAATACAGPIGQVAASTVIPAFAPGTVVKVELTTNVGGLVSTVSNAFIITIEASEALGDYAGDGGPTSFGPTTCAPGYAMTAMSGIYNGSANRVASIQGFCAPLKYPMDHTGAVSIGGVSAGGGTQPFDAVCDPSTVAVGLFGSTSGPGPLNGEIISLGVRCKSPSALAGPVTFSDGPYGGSPVAPFSIVCPAGTKMSGFQANYGSMINKIQLMCR